jgi:hypothetical protein
MAKKKKSIPWLTKAQWLEGIRTFSIEMSDRLQAMEVLQSQFEVHSKETRMQLDALSRIGRPRYDKELYRTLVNAGVEKSIADDICKG